MFTRRRGGKRGAWEGSERRRKTRELAPAKYYPGWLKTLGRGSCISVNVQLILTMRDIIFFFAGKLRHWALQGIFRGGHAFLDT